MPKYHTLPTVPAWATMARKRWGDGRISGVDGSMWMYRAVPMGPVDDAASPAASLDVGVPLLEAFDELASLSGPIRLTYRAMNRDRYRQVHILLVNVPRLFTPPRGSALAGYHLAQFPDHVIDRRTLLLGVRLVPMIDSEGIAAVVSTVVETLIAGGDEQANFSKDSRDVDAALTRAGLRRPSAEEMRIAETWWNQGGQADVPNLVHPDHLHLFTSLDAARAAARLVDDGSMACEDWPQIPDSHTVSFAAGRAFDLPYLPPVDPRAHWASRLVESGAVAVSMRGKVEPATVTRDELRRMRGKYRRDIAERYANGKLERAEQEQTFAELAEVEAFYAAGGTPTLIETSTVVAFTGRDERSGYDPTEVGRACGVQLSSMLNVQDRALGETMLASFVRANPDVRDLPSQQLAFSGLPSLSLVGDRDGALLGFTERDRQPAYMDPMAATDADSLPLALVVGQTGSGKAAQLSTIVPTPLSARFPAGSTTVGELRVGDTVFGRDGRPCTVTWLSDVDEHPEMFRITLSDGQRILADGNHQWVVSGFWDGNGARYPHRTAAIENWHAAQAAVDRIAAFADTIDPDRWVGLDDLFALVGPVNDGLWATPTSIYGAMRMTDCPVRRVTRTVGRTNSVTEPEKTDPARLFPAADTLRAWIANWSTLTGANAVRWGAQAAIRAAAARSLLAEVEAGDTIVEATVPDLIRRLAAIDPQVGTLDAALLRKTARSAGVTDRTGTATVRVPLPASTTMTREVLEYPARQAVLALALRVSQQAGVQPGLEPGEQVLSTNEMLGAGLRAPQGQARWAIRVPAPLDLPKADLPVAPYTLGAWLGDGTSYGASVTGPDREIIDRIVADGYPLRKVRSTINGRTGRASEVANTYTFDSLWKPLRAVQDRAESNTATKLDKRIPPAYLRASQAQRLALLQGLMDTDGTADANGVCELSLSKPDLAADALELIRSLGIKASMTSGAAGYRADDGTWVECADRHRIHFTTTAEVFSLPRKAALLPTQVRETQQWLYVTSIEPMGPDDPDYGPARCLGVDSPDHTYLIGYVPTHNSMLMSWLANQFARTTNSRGEQRPVELLDPKAESDFSAVAHLAGGQVFSLDDLAGAGGVFDPIGFSKSTTVAVELASSTLSAVNPWGTASERARWETPLLKALNYGVGRGATGTMEALEMAVADGQAPAAMVAPVRDVFEAAPMFRALCGQGGDVVGLAAAQGITYIKVGHNSLNLPAPGTPESSQSIPQRVSLQLVRNMVYGSMTALTGRQGVIMLDEAWVFTQAGRAEMERLGRLSRSMQVFPMLFTQRVTDALDAGLAGYISRGIILPIADEGEARSACELFRLQPTAARLARIMAPATHGDAPNWSSMRALIDPDTRQVLRGTIGIYADLHQRAVPTEIRIPPDFLAEISTNRLDMEARAARHAAVQAVQAVQAEQAPDNDPDAEQATAAAASPQPGGLEGGW